MQQLGFPRGVVYRPGVLSEADRPELYVPVSETLVFVVSIDLIPCPDVSVHSNDQLMETHQPSNTRASFNHHTTIIYLTNVHYLLLYSRLGETVADKVLGWISFVSRAGYIGRVAPIPVHNVAKAMVADYSRHREDFPRDDAARNGRATGEWVVYDGSTVIENLWRRFRGEKEL